MYVDQNADHAAQVSDHERLGHPGRSNGCKPCMEGKMARPTFKHHIVRTENHLEEISVDLMGPITPESLGGARYVLVVVDSATRFVWTSFLPSKDQALERIKQIIQLTRNRNYCYHPVYTTA